MSEKLDQSLDEILSTRRHSARRGGRGGRRTTNPAKATATAPVGGIKKSTKTARGNVRAVVPSGPAAGNGDSKIIVSNLVSGTFSLHLPIFLLTLHIASRRQRGPNQGMLILRPTHSWIFLASFYAIVGFSEPLRSSKGQRRFLSTTCEPLRF